MQDDTDMELSPDTTFGSESSDDEKSYDSNNDLYDESQQAARTREFNRNKTLAVRSKMDNTPSFDLLDKKRNINLKKVENFLSGLFSAIVIVDKLPDSTVRRYQRSRAVSDIEDVTSDNSDNETTFKKSLGTKDLTIRYCSKCKRTSKHSKYRSLKKNHFCQYCNSRLLFKCIVCENQYTKYHSMALHLSQKCRTTFETLNALTGEKSTMDDRSVELPNVPGLIVRKRHLPNELIAPAGTNMLTTKYCFKCMKTVAHDENLTVKSIQMCKSCNSRLSWQCRRCGELCICYEGARIHLKYKCNKTLAKGLADQPESADHRQNGVGVDVKKRKINNMIVNTSKSSQLSVRNLAEGSNKIGTKALTTKYCLKCKKTEAHDENLNARSVQMCKDCNSRLFWQCRRCDKFCSSHQIAIYHLNYKCEKRKINNMKVNASKNRPLRVASVTAESNKIVLGMRYLTKRYCSRCEWIFDNDPSLPQTKVLPCERCGNDLQWQCVICNKTSDSYKGMDNHLSGKCNAHRCKHCGFKTSSRMHLVRHVQSQHPVKACLNCGKEFMKPQCYNQHVSTCGSEKVIKCKFCVYTTLYKRNIKYHVKKNHSLADLTTDECIDYTFNAK